MAKWVATAPTLLQSPETGHPENPIFETKNRIFRGLRWVFQDGVTLNLEDRNLLKLRSLDSSCPFFLSGNSIWGQ